MTHPRTAIQLSVLVPAPMPALALGLALALTILVVPDAAGLRAQPLTSRSQPWPADLAPETRAALDRLTARLGREPRLITRPEARALGAARSRLVWLGGFHLPVLGTTARERAQGFLGEHGALLGIRAPVAARVRRVIPTAGGAVVRFGLEIEGRPLFGAGVVVTLRGDGVTSAAGGLPLLSSADDAEPVLGALDARRAVERATGRPVYRSLGLGYLIQGDSARLVHRLDQYRRRPPDRLLFAVDAMDGSILSVASGLRSAQGYVYDPSPTVAGNVYVSRTLGDLTGTTHLDGTYARAFQCGPMTGDMEELPCQNRAQMAAPTDVEGNYFILPQEPSLTDTFAEVQAYYHLTEFNRWVAQTFGFTWSCAGRQAIDVMVNMDYPNAFYGDADGDTEECADVTLGEGAVDYAYDAEVIFHEMGHGVVSQTAGLGCDEIGVCLDDQGVNLIPNGISEGMADYFSMTYTGSPILGEHAARDTGDSYIRTAENSNRCPWDLMGQSHNDGHIWMGGVWSLRVALGQTAADQLFFDTLAALPEDAELDVAAATMHQAAATLQAAGVLTAPQVQAVTDMLGPGDRNMDGCTRLVPLLDRPEGYEVALAYGLPSYPGIIEEWPLTLQFRLDTPSNARRIMVNLEQLWGWSSDYTVYLRRNQPVYIQLGESSPYVVADHTYSNSPMDVFLDLDDTPALEPGSTYYLALVYSADEDVLFSLTGYLETGPVIPPDGGVADGGGTGDAGPRRDAYVPPDAHRPAAYAPDSMYPRVGCACQGARPGGAPFALSLLLLAWLTRRRRP